MLSLTGEMEDWFGYPIDVKDMCKKVYLAIRQVNSNSVQLFLKEENSSRRSLMKRLKMIAVTFSAPCFRSSVFSSSPPETKYCSKSSDSPASSCAAKAGSADRKPCVDNLRGRGRRKT